MERHQRKKERFEQLRTIEQEGRTCDEYVQEFKKVIRESSYEEKPLIEEFKRGLNRAIRRKLAEAEELLTIIGEWQERVVRLDRNQRQSRAEKRILGRNAMCPEGNAQPRGGYKEGNQTGPRRDPNAIDIDRGREENKTCYVCGK